MSYSYDPQFWNGHRQDEVNAAILLENEDWQKFSRYYYRRFNDGDPANFHAMRRLARIYDVTFDRYRDPPFLDALGNKMLDTLLGENANA